MTDQRHSLLDRLCNGTKYLIFRGNLVQVEGLEPHAMNSFNGAVLQRVVVDGATRGREGRCYLGCYLGKKTVLIDLG